MLRLSLILAVFAVAMLALAPFAIAAEKADKADTVDGTFVKAADNKITIKDSDKKEHTYTLAKECKMTCDNKACTIDDLKEGMKVKLTLDKDTVTKLEATK